MKKLSVIEMPINLLAAVAKFASPADTMRPQLNGVYVDKDEIVACDGHRLVRVDTRVGPFEGTKIDDDFTPYLIPLEVALAIVAGVKATRARRIRATCADRILRVDACSEDGRRFFTVEARSAEVKYPPVDSIMIETKVGDLPSIIFDPRLLADIAPVLDACDAQGLEIAGWGGELSPMQFAATGVRFVVMPMRAR